MDLPDWQAKHRVDDQELADAVGVTRTYINKIRRGDVNPSLKTALDIYAYTDRQVELEQLVPRAFRPGFKLPPRRPTGPQPATDSVQTPAALRASRSRVSA